MMYKFRYYFSYKFIYPIKMFFIGLRNLYLWLPVIWKDRDWDFYYIYNVLKFKLDKQSNSIEKNGISTYTNKCVEEMRLVSKLIDIVNNEFYSTEYMDYIDWSYTSNFRETIITKDNLDEYFKKYPRQYKKVLDELSGEDKVDRELIAMKIGIINQERGRKLIFKMLDYKIDRWWD